jgi:hypothetical protein
MHGTSAFLFFQPDGYWRCRAASLLAPVDEKTPKYLSQQRAKFLHEPFIE